MLDQLRTISMMLNSINLEHAQNIVRSVSRSLANTLNAHIVDTLWGKEAAEGRVNLDPITSYDQTSRKGAKPHTVRDEGSSNVWSYVYLHARPVWIENIKRHDPSLPAINGATAGGQEFIEPQFLHFQQETDSFMAVPFFLRGVVRGVFCLELPFSGRLNLEVLRLLERLSDPIATILWKADVRRVQDEQIDNVIDEFVATYGSYTFQDSLKSHKIGFIARPFAQEFDGVEACIKRILQDSGASAQHFIFNPASGYVMDDLMKQMKSSQFGIADITRFNANVLLELGMMMQIFDKKLLILQRKDDQTQPPFDLRPFQIYQYELAEGPELRIWEPGNSQYEMFAPKLKEFITRIL